MNEQDCNEFAKSLKALAKLHNRSIEPESMAIYFRALERYTWEEVSAAMAAHERDPLEGRFFPLPAHIIGHLRSRNKRPSADEMWALVPISEQESAYWTVEAKLAFFQAALPLLEDGDRIGARMAFKAAYERLCIESAEHDWSIEWEFSPGWDVNGRESTLQKAIDKGLLTNYGAQQLLPTFNQGQIEHEITKLLSKINKKLPDQP